MDASFSFLINSERTTTISVGHWTRANAHITSNASPCPSCAAETHLSLLTTDQKTNKSIVTPEQ